MQSVLEREALCGRREGLAVRGGQWASQSVPPAARPNTAQSTSQQSLAMFGPADYCLLAALLATGLAVSYRTEFVNMRVDHFSFGTNDTFLLRFLVNDSFWDRNVGPIFLVPGGEESVEFFVENAAFVWESAESARAMVVFAEHRYQGWSKPYRNKSFSSLRLLGFLTVEQVLADYAGLIVYLRTEFPQLANSPVIAMGFGYSGQLAAWLRVKYPHLVLGAVASSAPVLEQSAECKEFPRIVTVAFNTSSPSCASAISRSWDIINRAADSQLGRDWLDYYWQLCYPLYTPHEVFMLKSWLAAVYTYLAYYNYPHPDRVGKPLPANPIQEACKSLNNAEFHSDAQFLQALYQTVNVYNNYTGQAHCLDTHQAVLLERATWAAHFMGCSELPRPLCPEGGDNDFFEPAPWDWANHSRKCRERWGVRPQPSFVARTFGPIGQGASSNIVFTNGLLDPQSAGGILYNVSSTVQAFNIPGGSHHAEFRASRDDDPPAVAQARVFVRERMAEWLSAASPIEPR